MARTKGRRVYRRGRPKRKFRQSKSKKMVVGHGPTALESIASGIGSVAKLAAAVAPAVMAINTEEKFFDKSFTATAYLPGTNDQIVDITSGIAQGTTDQTRIGNSLLAKNIYLKGYVYWLASTTVHSGISRLTMICWKENNQQNPPTIAKIFQNTTDIYAPVNKDYSDQFVVMKDKFFQHNAAISAATQQALHPIKIFKKLDWHQRFNGSGTTNGTVNHIFVIFRGAGATNANQSTFNLYSRMNYTDN